MDGLNILNSGLDIFLILLVKKICKVKLRLYLLLGILLIDIDFSVNCCLVFKLVLL